MKVPDLFGKVLSSKDMNEFIHTFCSTPDDIDMVAGLAYVSNHPAPLVSLSMVNTCTIILTVMEARLLADVFESGMRRFPHNRMAQELLPNTIMVLRATADMAEKEPAKSRKLSDVR